MDYKELATAVKLCGNEPNAALCEKCPYWSGLDMSKCIPRMTADAATAITDLLARAEAAEARCETLEKMVKEYQDTIVPGYRERAEKAERERDGFKQRYIEMTNRACELSKIVDDHGWEE